MALAWTPLLILFEMLYSTRHPSYALGAMLLVVAAMGEELGQAMASCPDCEKTTRQGLACWQARKSRGEVCFFKTGVGPRRSAENLERILNVLTPDSILLIGYAGALHPDLKVGDLVGVRQACACSMDEGDADLSRLRIDRRFELRDGDVLAGSAKALGMRAVAGDVLTSAYVLGEPEHKRLLYQKHGALIVDMETAALAGVAVSRNIPFSCARSVSDEAADAFLAPFSYNPAAGLATRAAKIIGSGIQSYQEWKSNAKIAGETLNRFLSCYL